MAIVTATTGHPIPPVVLVRFLRSHGTANPGDTASFRREDAQKLEAQGVAKIITLPDPKRGIVTK